MFERTDDRREPYSELRRVSISNVNICAATLVPSEEKLVLMTRNARLLYVLMTELMTPPGTDNAGGDGASSVPKGKESGSGLTLTTLDLVAGGFHTPVGRDPAVIAAAVAYTKPLIVTIGSDSMARFWNTATFQCLFVYDLRADAPTAVALHHSGYQVIPTVQ